MAFARTKSARLTKRKQLSVQRELQRLGVYVPKMSVRLTVGKREAILQAAKHDAISMQACCGEYHALLF